MSKSPNILMIVCDQLRYDCIGYSGIYPVKTPNIDRLAKQGVWFSNAYTPIPLCCPARQALLNGKRPETFGALWNYEISLKIPALEPTEYSWVRELQNNGYQYNTAYLGKWHVHPDFDPRSFGYGEYVSDDDYEAFRVSKYPNTKFTKGWSGETDPVSLEDSHTHWLASKAINIMHEYANQESPWHIRVDFSEPHLPCRPLSCFEDLYDISEIPKWTNFDDGFINKPYIQKQQLVNWNIENYTWDDWAPVVARYYATITQMDDAFGKIFAELEKYNLADDTMIIFTSDHGDMCGGHKMMDKHYVLYEDIVKVPFIISWPGNIQSGKKSSEYVYNCLDIAPTIIDLLGVECIEDFHGKSLYPMLKGDKIENWRREVVSTYNGQQFGLYTQRMIKNDDWKYIWNTTDIDELYDMKNDSDELKNLIQEESLAPVIKILRKKLYEILLHEGDGLVNNPWLKEQLLNNRKL